MVALIYILTNSLIGFPFSTPSPAFTLCRLFDDGHFTVALFSIAKTWKQPKYPSTEEQIKKMWYIHTMEYYSAIKRNEIMAFAATWMDLEIIMLSEVSKTQMTYAITYMWNPRK